VTKWGYGICKINEKYTQNSGQETSRKRPWCDRLMMPMKETSGVIFWTLRSVFGFDGKRAISRKAKQLLASEQRFWST